MTQEQFYSKYGDVKVKFAGYYKFTFRFVGILENGNKISCFVGGNAESIYKFAVNTDSIIAIKALAPYGANIFDEQGNSIDSYQEVLN